jgi:hypothetical protein
MITPIIRHTGSKLLGQQRLAGGTRIANLNTSSRQIPVGSLLYGRYRLVHLLICELN